MSPATQGAFAPELALPPPYQAVRLREFGDAFAHATALAPQRGAGTLVYVGRFDVAEFAVVLEPADPLVRARRAFYAGMGALAEPIASGWRARTARLSRSTIAAISSCAPQAATQLNVTPCCRSSPHHRGSISQPKNRRETLAHHSPRCIGHIRLRCGRRAWRAGGF